MQVVCVWGGGGGDERLREGIDHLWVLKSSM